MDNALNNELKKDELIKIAKKCLGDNAIIDSNDTATLDSDGFDHACEDIAESVTEKLPELLANSEWTKLPGGWLSCLKLLVCGARCYGGIIDVLQKEMVEHPEYAELYAKIPQVQGFGNRLDLALLSESNIDANTISGFEELLKIMRVAKEKAEAKTPKPPKLLDDDRFVIVIDNKLSYPYYVEFVKAHFNEYLKYFVENALPENNKIYKYIGQKTVLTNHLMRFLIQDTETKQVFLVENNGCERYIDGESVHLATRAEAEAKLKQKKKENKK